MQGWFGGNRKSSQQTQAMRRPAVTTRSADDSDSFSGAGSSTNGDEEQLTAEDEVRLSIELASINTNGRRRGSLHSNVSVPLTAIAAANEAEMIIEKARKEEILLRAEPRIGKDIREGLEYINNVVLLLDHIFITGKWLPTGHDIESCLDLLNSEVHSNEEQKASLDCFELDDFSRDDSKLHDIPEASRSFFTAVMEWQKNFSKIDTLLPEIFRFSSTLHEESLNPYPISLQPVFKLHYLHQILQKFEGLALKDQFHLWMRSKMKEQESEFEELFDTDPFPEEAEFEELFAASILPAEEAELEKFIAAIRKFLFMVIFSIKMLDQFKAMIDDAKKYQKNIYKGSNDTSEVCRKEEQDKKIQNLNAKLNAFFDEYACANAEELARLSLVIQACLPGVSLPILKLWVENNADLITTQEDRRYLANQLSLDVLSLTMTLTVNDGLVKVRLKNNDRSMLQDLFIPLNKSTHSFEQASVVQEIMDTYLDAIRKNMPSNKKNIVPKRLSPFPENLSCVTDLLERISDSGLENRETLAVLGVYILLYTQYGPSNKEELNTESHFLLMSLLAKIAEERHGYDLPASKFHYENIKVELPDQEVEEEPSRLSFVSSKKNKDIADVSAVLEYIFSDDRENEPLKKEKYPYSDIVLSTLDCESLIQKLTSLDYMEKIEILLATKFNAITPVQRNRIKRTADLLAKLPQAYRLRLIKNKHIKALKMLGLLLTYEEILCKGKPSSVGSALFITEIAKNPANTLAFEFVLFYEIFLRFKQSIKTSRDIWEERNFRRPLLVDVFQHITGDAIDVAVDNEREDFALWVEDFLEKKVIANPSEGFVKMLGWFNNKELQRIFLTDSPAIVLALPELRLKNQDIMSQFEDDLSSSLQIESVIEIFILLAVQEAALKFYQPMQETNNKEMLVNACRYSWVLQFRFLSVILDEKLKGFALSSSNEVMKNGICQLSSNMIRHIVTLPKKMTDLFAGSRAGIQKIVSAQDFNGIIRGVVFGFARFVAIIFHHFFSEQKDNMSSDAHFFFQMYQHFQGIVIMMGVDLSCEDPAIIFAMMVYFFDTPKPRLSDKPPINLLLQGTNISMLKEHGFFEGAIFEIDHLKKREDLNVSYSFSEGKIQLACDYDELDRISSDDGVAPLYKSMFFSNSAERITCELALANIRYVLPS